MACVFHYRLFLTIFLAIHSVMCSRRTNYDFVCWFFRFSKLMRKLIAFRIYRISISSFHSTDGCFHRFALHCVVWRRIRIIVLYSKWHRSAIVVTNSRARNGYRLAVRSHKVHSECTFIPTVQRLDRIGKLSRSFSTKSN